MPGATPERFAPGVVSTDAIELNALFTPDGREFFFTRLVDGVDTIHQSRFGNGTWSRPALLMLFPGAAKAVAVDMSVSREGQELFFLGEHAHEHAPGAPGSDILGESAGAGHLVHRDTGAASRQHTARRDLFRGRGRRQPVLHI